MKTLMLGNEAVARGLFEGGCSFVSSYPGTPSTEITECIATYKEVYAEWAPNEKVAMEAAFGACLAGQRSFCAMKHVGLNVAADPLFTIGYTGVNASCESLDYLVDLMEEVCLYHGIEMIDMTHSSILTRDNAKALLPDYVHPTVACHEVLGRELAGKILFH